LTTGGVKITVKVSLVIPDSPWAIDPLRSFPPLGVLYISAYLKQHGVEVEVVDLAGGCSLPDIEAEIVGVTAVTPQYPLALDIMRKIKAKNPDILVVGGGSHFTVAGDVALGDGWDWVVKGEGEKAMLSLAVPLIEGKGLLMDQTKIPIENLDSLPFPDWDAVDMSRYKYEWRGERCASLIASRGCPWGRCAFCCDTWTKPVRWRSPQNVVNEILELQRRGYPVVYFYDDCFNLFRPWLKKFCELVKPVGEKWRCLIRSDIEKCQAELMAKAGCIEVFIGQESGSNRILNNIDKGVTAEQGLKAVQYCAEEKMHVRVGLIIGLPGESKETVDDTKRWIEAAKGIYPELDFDYTICTVYPGSPIWNHPERYDITFCTNFSKLIYKRPVGEYEGVVSTSHLSGEKILRLQREVEEEFGSWGLKLAKRGDKDRRVEG